ncbi:MAG: HTH-type transcriptional regulator IscR [Phycisphaerae bacterium]|nr:HTH-type transcriptional regulator IscR [Phycisphaerae bacterium]
MRIGKTSVYGVFATLYVAQHANGKPVQGRDIAEAYGIPVEYLLKILQLLARGGILKSERGRAGGFVLNHTPDHITLYDVFNALESMPDYNQLLEESINGAQRVKSHLQGLFSQLVNNNRDILRQLSIRQLVEMEN